MRKINVVFSAFSSRELLLARLKQNCKYIHDGDAMDILYISPSDCTTMNWTEPIHSTKLIQSTSQQFSMEWKQKRRCFEWATHEPWISSEHIFASQRLRRGLWVDVGEARYMRGKIYTRNSTQKPEIQPFFLLRRLFVCLFLALDFLSRLHIAYIYFIYFSFESKI